MNGMQGWIHQSGFNLDLGQTSSSLTGFSIKFWPKLLKSDPNPSNLTDEPATELEGTLAGKEKKLEYVRTKHEDQIAAIKEQKAKKLGQIETEEAVQLEHLRKGGVSIEKILTFILAWITARDSILILKHV